LLHALLHKTGPLFDRKTSRMPPGGDISQAWLSS
jgi:hypothetical protein